MQALHVYMLIGSPVCTQFCTWQALNRFKHGDSESKERARVEAILHMDFIISLYTTSSSRVGATSCMSIQTGLPHGRWTRSRRCCRCLESAEYEETNASLVPRSSEADTEETQS